MAEPPADRRAFARLRAIIAEVGRTAKRPVDAPDAYRAREALELSDTALVDRLFTHIDPNPDRQGCPPPPVLQELAARTRPFSDPWWTHIMACAPCRIDIRQLSQGAARPPATPSPRRAAWWPALAVTGGAIVTIAGRQLVQWFRRRRAHPPRCNTPPT